MSLYYDVNYILIAVTCSNCGGEMAVKAFGELPTEEQKRDLCEKLGGMFCIKTRIFRQDYVGDYDLVEEEDDEV